MSSSVRAVSSLALMVLLFLISGLAILTSGLASLELELPARSWGLSVRSAAAEPDDRGPVKVAWNAEKGLLRGGEPYFIKGAGGDNYLQELKARGGNSFRTWSTDDLENLLNKGHSLGLTVCAGIWLEPECDWFSYGNPDHCARQTARVQEIVRKWRHHPALLLWGLGNEVEGDGKNAAFWRQIGSLAELVHREDPAHPCFTALAGITAEKAAGMNEHAPALDFAGINTYGALPGLRAHLEKVKWTRPWIVTEYGAQGFWERPRSAWGAPLEQTSGEKAVMLEKAYPVISRGGQCAGGYAFLWGQKQEATSTWFGMFTESGESTAAVDVLEKIWSGKAPANRAPEVSLIAGLPAGGIVPPGGKLEVSVTAADPDKDGIVCTWSLYPEDAAGRDSRGMEIPPPEVKGAVTGDGTKASVAIPDKPGAKWRLYVRVSDGKGHAATANSPIKAADR